MSKIDKQDDHVYETPIDDEANFELEGSKDIRFHHVFQDPVMLEYYQGVYEKSNYECKDYLDPDLTWTLEEERKIVRKTDLNVVLWAFVMFAALNLDRSNINQALSDNLLADLGLTTDDYNIGNTVNYSLFLAAELPSQLISKRLGAHRWIPIQMSLWSIVTLAQFWMNGRASYIICRGLIGLLEGGFICDMILWMTYFYTKSEFPFRISLFYVSAYTTSIISAFLALGLLKIKTADAQDGWRWLFLIEGAITLLIGIASFFQMPASVVSTRAWYRKNGWYTEREEAILVNKILRDEPLKGDMSNTQPIGPKELFKAFFDIDMIPIYIVRLLADISSGPISSYLSLTLRSLGFSTAMTNLLSVPVYVLGIIGIVAMGWLSSKTSQHAYLIVISPIWLLACLIPYRYWPGSRKDLWGTYAILVVLLGHFPHYALTAAWSSANANSVRNRAVSAAVVNMCSQAANIISANIYRLDDAPYYKRGNTQLIGIAFGATGACFFARAYYAYRNKQRDRKWNSMTIEQQEHYRTNTTDEANKRLDFRFTL